MSFRLAMSAFLSGESRGPIATVSRLALAPCSVLYGTGAALRRQAYDWGFVRSRPLPVPVVSVGNLVVGGTGKTPLVRHLAGELIARGVHPLVVSRGFGARAAGDCLDEEGRSLVRDLPGLVVSQGRDRVAAALRALDDDRRPRVVLLDDGAQALHCARDFEILLVDARRPFGAGWTLPAGALREPRRLLGRADLIVVSRADELAAGDRTSLVRRLDRWAPLVGRAFASHRASHLLPGPACPSELSGRRVFAVSGIARPAPFHRELRRLGAEVAGFRAFPDHHRFRARDLERVAREAQGSGAELVVATGKDEPKLALLPPPALPLRFLEVRLELEPEGRAPLAALLDRIVEAAHGA